MSVISFFQGRSLNKLRRQVQRFMNYSPLDFPRRYYSLDLSFSFTHTHTHTHTQIEKRRNEKQSAHRHNPISTDVEREREAKGKGKKKRGRSAIELEIQVGLARRIFCHDDHVFDFPMHENSERARRGRLTLLRYEISVKSHCVANGINWRSTASEIRDEHLCTQYIYLRDIGIWKLWSFRIQEFQ